MRSFLATVLAFSLLISTLYAQVGTPPQSKPKLITAAPVVDVPPAPQVPSFIYECDGNQCTRGGGGAIWLFEGHRGQAMWHYGAIAALTVTQFDGNTIVIHREDPNPSYSSPRYADPTKRKDGVFFADYTGTIHGSRIDGTVIWNGGGRGTWYANLPQSLCNPFDECPLETGKLVGLGQNAVRAKLYRSGLRCFLAASGQGDATGQELAGLMLRDGVGAPRDYAVAFYFLGKSAEHDDYNAQLALSQMYEEGMGIPKSSDMATYWKQRAQKTADQLRAQQAQQQFAGLFAALLFAGVAASIEGAATGGDDTDIGQRLADQDHLRDEIRQSRENAERSMEKVGHPDDQ